MSKVERRVARLGSVTALGGIVVYGVSAFLHPGTAPHLTEAAFAHYAAEPWWGLIHLGELFGVFLMSGAALALAWRLHRSAPISAVLAGTTMVVFASVYAVFIAVDGVALGMMVDRWAQAEPGRRALLYETAFAVRQIEAGLFGVQWLVFGVATGLFAVAFLASGEARASPSRMRTMGALSALASLGALAFGIVQIQTGFTATSMAFQTGLSFGVLWGLAVAVFLYRHPETPPLP